MRPTSPTAPAYSLMLPPRCFMAKKKKQECIILVCCLDQGVSSSSTWNEACERLQEAGWSPQLHSHGILLSLQHICVTPSSHQRSAHSFASCLLPYHSPLKLLYAVTSCFWCSCNISKRLTSPPATTRGDTESPVLLKGEWVLPPPPRPHTHSFLFREGQGCSRCRTSTLYTVSIFKYQLFHMSWVTWNYSEPQRAFWKWLFRAKLLKFSARSTTCKPHLPEDCKDMLKVIRLT